MFGNHVVLGVHSVRSAIRDITNLNRDGGNTHLMIGKGIFAGSLLLCDVAPQYDFPPGSIELKRLEALCMEYTLRHAAQQLKTEDADSIGASLLSNSTLSQTLQQYTAQEGLSYSSFLPIAARGLGEFKRDYRIDRLTDFGQQVALKLNVAPIYTHLPPEDVDIRTLDRRRLSSTVKRLYREYRVIEDVANQCWGK